MRILYRQTFREVFSHALLGLILFTFVLFLRDTTRLLELGLRETVLWKSVLHLAVLSFPALLVFTLPMAVLVGILIGLSRMASDGEITALRASGIGARTLLVPVGSFAALGCALALYLSLVLAPQSNREQVAIEKQLGFRQISAELQPRVFEERFPNLLLYVQDIVSGPQPVWKGIFLADLANPQRPKITLARQGILLSDPEERRFQLHLEQGSIHEAMPQSQEYSIATFAETDLPIQMPLPPPSAVKPNAQRSLAELAQIPSKDPDWLEARVELHRRFALPFAILFLAMTGIPLALSAHKAGKPMGILLTLLMVLVYYTLLIGGISLARQSWLPAWLGVWGANLLFAAGGVFLLRRVDHVDPLLGWMTRLGEIPKTLEAWFSSRRFREKPDRILRDGATVWDTSFPRILDAYVIKTFLFYLVVIVAALLVLTVTVTFFLDLLNDVIRNQIPAAMVADYFLHLTPQLLYLILPLGVLVASLVSFGMLAQSNEITAIKAAGISLYRIALPVFVLAALLSAALFLLEYSWIPAANRHQDAVRNRIKGRPAQTYLRPDRRWLLGEGGRIYYYNFFAPAERVLGGVSVFELDPETFQLVRRISASRAQWEPSLGGWVFQEGWVREMDRASVRSFQDFPVRLFPELHEPPDYFLKEVKQSTQMNFLELRRYLQDLRQSGFDVVPLTVQLHKKFSFPLFAFIMALIGIPFAFSIGKKGALTGIACSLGIAMVYWIVSSLFEALGNLNQLPPLAAAWSPNLLFGLGGIYLLLRVDT